MTPQLCATESQQASEKKPASRRSAILALLLGTATTLFVYGYQFGRGNHAVYLPDAIHRADPSLLASDWFTTQTFQYHVVFSTVASWLMRLGIIQPAFLIAYLLLVVLFHVALRGIVRDLEGGDGAYLLCVTLYYFSAAGTGLGMYQFFQDSSLLPSNIANVAMLWAIYFWVTGRSTASGCCFGIAAAFHLNFAVVGIGVWLALNIWRSRSLPWKGTVLAIVPGAVNIVFGLQEKLSREGSMPLEEFVKLYVRFRHPHHYDPSSWPIGIWIAFAWTIAPALLVLRGRPRRVVTAFLAILCVPLVWAGIWFKSETLIQMSLYRFSIFPQLLGCAAAAVWICRLPGRQELATLLGWTGCILIIIVSLIGGPYFGMFKMPKDDANYISLCQWVSQNTPADAIFLVPPDEESMRLVGRRAIVVNFKAVPQLSGELPEWNRRMCDVLDLNNLYDDLPRGYTQTLSAIKVRYALLSPEQLLATARKYRARFIVTGRTMSRYDEAIVYSDASQRWFVYDLGRGRSASAESLGTAAGEVRAARSEGDGGVSAEAAADGRVGHIEPDDPGDRRSRADGSSSAAPAPGG